MLFSSDEPDREKLCSKIEAAILKTFTCRASVVVRSLKELRAVVEGAPRGFGKQPEKFRYDVLFLKEPLTAAVASKIVPTKAGVDQLFTGKGVLYFSRLEKSNTEQAQPGHVAADLQEHDDPQLEHDAKLAGVGTTA